jgi:hypothetical protein
VSEPPEPLESRLSSVERALAELDGRLRVLERGAAAPRTELLLRPVSASAKATSTDLARVFTPVGRTLVIFAGGYLLRALTELGTLTLPVGAVLGLVYAAIWTVAASRVAPGDALSATAYGSATVLIAFPLLWEATLRFALFPPAVGAVALAAATAIVLVTAWRRHLHALAWITTLSACAFGSAFIVATGHAVAFTIFLVALGVATLWLGYDREWIGLRWVTATLANVAVLALVGRALATPPRDEPSHVMAAQVLLLVGYLGSIGIRTLVRGRDVVPFEVVQTAVMLLTALGGALLLTHRTGFGALMLGPALLTLAVGCYAIEFIDRRQTRGANRYFYTSLAIVFALTGAELILDGAALAIAWVTLSVVVGWAGSRYARPTLGVHSVIFLSAAALTSGLITTTLVGLFASETGSWASLSAVGWAALVALAISWWFATRLPERGVRGVPHLLRLVLASLAVLSLVGVGIVGIRSLLLSGAGQALPAGAIATLRTGVLAGAALTVAWLGRNVATREFGALLYPLLGWGAVKLLVEDFRTSPPLLLFVAFALYGGALIAGPQMARYRRRAHHATPGAR